MNTPSVSHARICSTSIVTLGLLFIAAFSAAPQVQAATVTWDGEGGDGLWSTPANWSGNALPSGTDNIIIENAGEVHLNINFVLTGSIAVGNSSLVTDTLIVDNGVTLTNNGPFRNIVVSRNDSLVNFGVVTSSTGCCGSINIGGGASVINNQTMTLTVIVVDQDSTFTNNGTLSKVIADIYDGTFNNNGTFNHAIIDSALGSSTRMATINNSVGATINTTPTADFDSTRMLIRTAADIVNNHGTITNDRTIVNDATFNNFGVVDTRIGSFSNSGTFNSECDSVLLGSLSENQPIIITCDVIPPVVTVSSSITTEATSAAGAAVTFSASAEDETDGPLMPVCTPASGAIFTLGITTVSCTATDEAGNTGSASFNITVVDTTRPTLIPPDDVIAEANGVLSTVFIGRASASDIFNVTAGNDAPAAGYPVGDTTVTWFARDESGNETLATQTVTIVDTTLPVLTIPPDVTVDATGAQTVVDIGVATATDIFDVTIVNNAPGSFPVGTTEVTWAATDANGNTTSAVQNVTVLDTTPPVIVPNVTGTLGLAGWYVSDVSVSWTVTDPESAIVSMVGCQPDSVTTDTTGVTFTCTASSAGGGSSFSTTIMRDVTLPVVVFGDPSPPANTAGWHNSIVSVSYSCDDTTSGSGDSGVLQTGQEGTGITVDATCVDTAGNSASATSGPFNIDRTPPTVSITSPIDDATFIQNETINSAYSCADVLSDVSSCIGPVISGAYVDTTVIGGQSFAVTGTDGADNTTSLTHGYMVITVSNAVANVMDLVASFNLQQGLDNSFDAKLSNLQAALDASNAGQRNNAINMIQAFLNEVEAQRDKKLTNEQADSLVAEANRILMILSQ